MSNYTLSTRNSTSNITTQAERNRYQNSWNLRKEKRIVERATSGVRIIDCSSLPELLKLHVMAKANKITSCDMGLGV